MLHTHKGGANIPWKILTENSFGIVVWHDFISKALLEEPLLWQTLEHAATSILVGKYFLPLKSVAIKKAIAVIGNIVKNSVLSQRMLY